MSISAGRTTQQGTSNLGGFWSALMTTSLTQMNKKQERRDTLLDLTLANKEEQVRDVMARGNLCCSDCGMVKFRIVRGETKVNSRITTLSFRRTDFGLFSDGLGRIPWVMILEGRGV